MRDDNKKRDIFSLLTDTDLQTYYYKVSTFGPFECHKTNKQVTKEDLLAEADRRNLKLRLK